MEDLNHFASIEKVQLPQRFYEVGATNVSDASDVCGEQQQA